MTLKEKLGYLVGIPAIALIGYITLFIIFYNPPMKHAPDVRALTYYYNKIFE